MEADATAPRHRPGRLPEPAPGRGLQISAGGGPERTKQEKSPLRAFGPLARRQEATQKPLRLFRPLVVRPRLAVVRPGVVPGADVGAHRRARPLEQAEGEVAIAVEEPADRVDRHLEQRAFREADRGPPEGAIVALREVVEEPGADVETLTEVLDVERIGGRSRQPVLVVDLQVVRVEVEDAVEPVDAVAVEIVRGVQHDDAPSAGGRRSATW